MLKVLACDFGTTTGWALRYSDGKVRHGTASFKPPPHQAIGWRYARFQRFLEGARHAADGLDHFLYENVSFIAERKDPKTGRVMRSGFQAVQLWGGFEAIATSWCEYHGIAYHAIHVATLKKTMTGYGRGDKDGVKAAVTALGHKFKDDNESDAIALYYHFKRVIEPDYQENAGCPI